MNRSKLLSRKACRRRLFDSIQTRFQIVMLLLRLTIDFCFGGNCGLFTICKTLSLKDEGKTEYTWKMEKIFRQHLTEKGQSNERCCKSSPFARQKGRWTEKLICLEAWTEVLPSNLECQRS